jgi:hypothetical protein
LGGNTIVVAENFALWLATNNDLIRRDLQNGIDLVIATGGFYGYGLAADGGRRVLDRRARRPDPRCLSLRRWPALRRDFGRRHRKTTAIHRL